MSRFKIQGCKDLIFTATESTNFVALFYIDDICSAITIAAHVTINTLLSRNFNCQC